MNAECNRCNSILSQSQETRRTLMARIGQLEAHRSLLMSFARIVIKAESADCANLIACLKADAQTVLRMTKETP